MAITKVKPEVPQSEEKDKYGFKWGPISTMVKEFRLTLIDYEEEKKLEKMKAMFVKKIKSHDSYVKKHKTIMRSIDIFSIIIAIITSYALFRVSFFGDKEYEILSNGYAMIGVLVTLGIVSFGKSDLLQIFNFKKSQIKYYVQDNIQQYLAREIKIDESLKNVWLEKRLYTYKKLELYSWKSVEEFVKKEKDLAESFQQGVRFEENRNLESEEQQIMDI